MHSIIGQGKVEQILGSKPEERRALLEEAAGLGKFKARRHRAELKLSRVATQVERARDVEAEVKKRLRPLALQATAAERAEKLIGELARLRARVAQLDLATIDERRAEGEQRKQAAMLARRDLDARLETLLRDRNRVEEDSRTRPASAKRQRLRCIACAARASACRCAASRRKPWSRGCATSWSSRVACSTSACARSARRSVSACVSRKNG